MYLLYFVYFFFVFLTVLLKYFDGSLRMVQYYYHRYLNDVELFQPRVNFPLFMLGCCVLCGVLLETYETEFFFDTIYILYGLSYKSAHEIKWGFMCVYEDAFIISLKSTHCLDDVLLSLDNELVEINKWYGKLHKGYVEIVMGILPAILDVMYRHSNIRKIYLTGHSLGGALVSVLSIILKEYFGDLYEYNVYTFGCPKYCDESLREMMNDNMNIVNYMNAADPIINKPLDPRYVRLGRDITWKIETGNDNVNHGIRAYKECVQSVEKSKIGKRFHRFDELLSRFILDLLSS